MFCENGTRIHEPFSRTFFVFFSTIFVNLNVTQLLIGLRRMIRDLNINPFPSRQILDSSKLKEFADDNFKFDETGRNSIQIGIKHCGKRRNCSLRAISPFPSVYKRHALQTRKNQGLFGEGLKGHSWVTGQSGE